MNGDVSSKLIFVQNPYEFTFYIPVADWVRHPLLPNLRMLRLFYAETGTTFYSFPIQSHEISSNLDWKHCLGLIPRLREYDENIRPQYIMRLLETMRLRYHEYVAIDSLVHLKHPSYMAKHPNYLQRIFRNLSKH